MAQTSLKNFRASLDVVRMRIMGFLLRTRARINRKPLGLGTLIATSALLTTPMRAVAQVPEWTWTIDGVTGAVTNAFETMVYGFIAIIGWIMQWIAGFLMYQSSQFLDVTIQLALGDFLTRVSGIQIGWQVLRDFANLFFIFIILYIAIETILQLGGHNTKQMLVRVIVVALLINFSAFFTRVVIDAGNVVAVGFYNQIISSPPPRAPDPTNPNCATSPCSIGQRFASALEVNKFPNLRTSPSGDTEGNSLGRATSYFFNALFLLLIAFIFLKGAFYMLARTVAFMFLIMFSPIAFLGYAFPNGSVKQFGEKWWSKLMSYTLLAPFYMMIIYLVLLVIGADGFLSQSATVNMLNYALVVALLWVGSNYAFDMADSAGKSLVKWGSAAALGGGIWAGAKVGSFVGRQVGKRMVNDDVRERAATGDKGAQRRLMLANQMQAGTWDPRNTKAGKYVTSKLDEEGLKVGWAATTRVPDDAAKKKREEKMKQAEALFPGRPDLQARFLGGDQGTPGYDPNDDTHNHGALGTEEHEEAYVTGFDANNNPIYGRRTVQRNVFATNSEIADKRKALQRKDRVETARTTLQAGVDVLNSGNLTPAQQTHMMTAIAASLGNASTTGAILADLPTRVIEHPSVVRHMTPAQVRGIAANEGTSDATLQTILNVARNTGNQPLINYITNARANPESRWSVTQ